MRLNLYNKIYFLKKFNFFVGNDPCVVPQGYAGIDGESASLVDGYHSLYFFDKNRQQVTFVD